ncbi:C40 family peptidase [Bacteroides sp. ET336]|uniref:C40 family peptidase n=1 Tax=Bacteroides sp. ET336 TaxID=2972459 RepID=UPI0035C93EA8
MAVCISVLLLLSSCGSHRFNYDFRDLAAAAIRLDMDIEMNDNHKLYIEAADWIGTPYRYGGKTKKGVDCSGLTSAIYKTVYMKKLGRSAEDQRNDDCRKILKRNLREGDLVFFHNGKKKRKASHVGIYLKNGRFIHASSSVGVVVSSLNERYYEKHWLQGGRVK